MAAVEYPLGDFGNDKIGCRDSGQRQGQWQRQRLKTEKTAQGRERDDPAGRHRRESAGQQIFSGAALDKRNFLRADDMHHQNLRGQ